MSSLADSCNRFIIVGNDEAPSTANDSSTSGQPYQNSAECSEHCWLRDSLFFFVLLSKQVSRDFSMLRCQRSLSFERGYFPELQVAGKYSLEKKPSHYSNRCASAASHKCELFCSCTSTLDSFISHKPFCWEASSYFAALLEPCNVISTHGTTSCS
jgi:hypothetical protein